MTLIPYAGAEIRRRPPRAAPEADLAAEVRRLRDKVAALEAALYGTHHERPSFPFPRREATMAGLLVRYRLVTLEMALGALEAAIPSGNGHSAGDVYLSITLLRRHLRPHDVTVRSTRHVGWWLDSADRARLREIYAG